MTSVARESAGPEAYYGKICSGRRSKRIVRGREKPSISGLQRLSPERCNPQKKLYQSVENDVNESSHQTIEIRENRNSSGGIRLHSEEWNRELPL
jgi:hypothetical protein